MSLNPFDDFRALLTALPELDNFSAILTKKNFNDKGSLAEAAAVCASLTSYEKLAIKKPVMAIFAGTQTVLGEEHNNMISDTVINMHTGGNILNGLCNNLGLTLRIYDLALQYPIMNIKNTASMDERSCAATMAFGLETIAGNLDMLAITTVDSGIYYSEDAIYAAIFCNGDNKILKKYNVDILDGFELLRFVGNRESLAIMGALLASRIERVPVVLSGYTALIVAALLKKMAPMALKHCVIAARDERYLDIIEYLNIPVILGCGLTENRGIEAVMATSAICATVNSIKSVKTFAESKKILENSYKNQEKQ